MQKNFLHSLPMLLAVVSMLITALAIFLPSLAKKKWPAVVAGTSCLVTAIGYAVVGKGNECSSAWTCFVFWLALGVICLVISKQANKQ